MLQGENNKRSGSTSASHNSSGSSGSGASVAVTVAIPVGPDWAILERNFWPKRANKASDADRLAVKMRIAEVIYRGKQSVCQRYFPRSYVQLSREREHIQRSS